ncbi:MAG TPA: SRPBCC domain-containing protein, partial [Niastella sp.]|nr:SRPBCC domain-containing protein [Niastella sp.]
GTFHYRMGMPDGNEMWGLFTFREMEAPGKLVFVNSFADADGNIARAPFFTDWPLEILNILTLEEDNGKTKLTLRGNPINATAGEYERYLSLFDSMKQGFGGTFDQLDEYVTAEKSSTKNRELRISRLLDAPVKLVWEVWTNPEHIAKWWGPNGFTNTISTMDVKPGGAWNLVMHGPDGTDYSNKSIFKEIVPEKKMVYEHITSPKFIATITFEEQGKQTLLNWHMLFESEEQFIQVVKTFKADEGIKQNVEKLAAYLNQFV